MCIYVVTIICLLKYSESRKVLAWWLLHSKHSKHWLLLGRRNRTLNEHHSSYLLNSHYALDTALGVKMKMVNQKKAYNLIGMMNLIIGRETELIK